VKKHAEETKIGGGQRIALAGFNGQKTNDGASGLSRKKKEGGQLGEEGGQMALKRFIRNRTGSRGKKKKGAPEGGGTEKKKERPRSPAFVEELKPEKEKTAWRKSFLSPRGRFLGSEKKVGHFRPEELGTHFRENGTRTNNIQTLHKSSRQKTSLAARCEENRRAE